MSSFVADTTKKTKNNNASKTKKGNSMEYKVSSPKLQDIQTKTVRITARAAELGVVTATTITIALSAISDVEDIAATDVLVSRNLTDSTTAVASIVGTNLVLTDTAIAATDLFDLVIRLK